jgi:hypothetical protein
MVVNVNDTGNEYIAGVIDTGEVAIFTARYQ